MYEKHSAPGGRFFSLSSCIILHFSARHAGPLDLDAGAGRLDVRKQQCLRHCARALFRSVRVRVCRHQVSILLAKTRDVRLCHPDRHDAQEKCASGTMRCAQVPGDTPLLAAGVARRVPRFFRHVSSLALLCALGLMRKPRTRTHHACVHTRMRAWICDAGVQTSSVMDQPVGRMVFKVQVRTLHSKMTMHAWSFSHAS